MLLEFVRSVRFKKWFEMFPFPAVEILDVYISSLFLSKIYYWRVQNNIYFKQ